MSAFQALLRDKGARWVLAGWSLFTIENVIMSEYRVEIRRSWGGAGGQGAYQTMYSSLSAATLGSTIFSYYKFAQASAVLRSPPGAAAQVAAFVWRAGGLFAMGQLLPPVNLGAAPIALGLHTPSQDLPPAERGAMGCPFDMNAHKGRGEVYGITRITRRPELFGLGAVAVGGAILATNATQMAFFGVGPLISFAILGLHSDRTQRMGKEMSAEKEASTSLTPFVALVDGRQSWSALYDETVASNAGGAVLLALLAAMRPPWMRWVR